MSHYRWQGSDLVLFCLIQPRASCDEIVGPHGQRLKIRLSAPPVDGQANEKLLRFIGKQFGVARNRVTLIAGTTAREKSVTVHEPQKLPEKTEITAL